MKSLFTFEPAGSTGLFPAIALLLLLAQPYAGAQQIADLEVLTEQTPFTTAEPHNNNSGEATVFVKQVLNQANIEYNISFIPWKRSYQYAQVEPNILIYPLARTEQREKDFIWIGNIIPVSYFLFKLKSRNDISLKAISEAKSYSIGVVNKHAHHEFLISKGFTKFQTVNNSTQNLSKLLLGRIDLFPLSSGGLEPLCAKLEVDCAQIIPAIALENFSDGLYIALSNGSDPAIKEKLEIAYEAQITSPEYISLFSHRLNSARKIESSFDLQH